MQLLHLKDLLTIGTIVIGFIGSLLAMQGHFLAACCTMLPAFLFDIADGRVARMTGTANSFGRSLDSTADLIPYSVAPAFIVYAYFEQHTLTFIYSDAELRLLPWIPLTINNLFAGFMAIFPLVTGCLRLARNNAYSIDIKGFDLGLSRPATAFYITGIVGNHLSNSPYYIFIAVPAIIAISYCNLIFVPFVTEKGRTFHLVTRCLLLLTAIVIVISFLETLLTCEPYFMDVLLVTMFFYSFSGFLYSEREERLLIRASVQKVFFLPDGTGSDGKSH